LFHKKCPSDCPSCNEKIVGSQKAQKWFNPRSIRLLADLLSFLLFVEFDRFSIKSNGWSNAASKNYAISH
jgi:hypothetical protein